MSVQPVKNRVLFIIFWTWVFFTSSCAITPPVQEMSNARQTIAAAHEVKAQVYAPDYILEAERFMEQASEAMEQGDYLTARDYAVEAQQHAIKARQQAVSRQNN